MLPPPTRLYIEVHGMEWKKGLMLCVDTETTGLEPGKDKIVEVGAVLYRDKEVLRKECWLVNPGIPIPQEATAVHGITNASTDEAPAFLEIAETFLSLVLEPDVLVGYNWPFDAGFFEAELGDAWRESIKGKPIIDVLTIVRSDDVGRFWKGKGRHKLEAVANRLKIKPEGDFHRASTDCVLTLRILERLLNHLPDDGAAASALIAKRREEQDADFQAWLARQRAGK